MRPPYHFEKIARLTKPSSDNNAGIEGGRNAANGCTGTLQNGVVPWRALGLSENDVSDGWEREGENDFYFNRFSEKIAYPLGINIIFYLMTH